MLFQLQVIPSPDDGFHMFMCRRKDMLTEEEKEKIREKHKDDPDPEEAAQQEMDDYNRNEYGPGSNFSTDVPEFHAEILEEEVPEEYMNEYNKIRKSIEETNKVKVNGMKTGKFFKTQKSPFGCAYSEDSRPRDCYLYKVITYGLLENQENISTHPEALGMKIQSSSIKIEEAYVDSEEETLDYAQFIMEHIRKLIPIEDPDGNPIPYHYSSLVNWGNVCRTEDFDEDFMRDYKDYLNWETASIYQSMSEPFLLEFKDSVDWKKVSEFQTLSENFIKENINMIDIPRVINGKSSLSVKTLKEFIDTGVTSWENIFNSISPSLDTIDKYKDIIDWKLVCESCRLTEEFIDSHLDYISPYWDTITKIQDHLSEEFLKNHENDINWAIASDTQTLSKELINDHYMELDWIAVCKNQSLDEDIIDKYPSRMNWHNLLTNIKFTEDQLDKYFDHLKGEWITVAIFQKISIKWLEKHINDIDKEDWNMLASNMEFDIDFIRKYKSRVDWTIISGPKYILTEAFIDEFKDYVDWQAICVFQNMSNNFIMDHYQYIDWAAISKNNEILTEEFIDRHKKKLSWNALETVFQMSEEFIENHIEYVTWYNLFRFQNLSKEFIEKYRWKLTEEERQELGV